MFRKIAQFARMHLLTNTKLHASESKHRRSEDARLIGVPWPRRTHWLRQWT